MFGGFDPFDQINSMMRRSMDDMDAMMGSMMGPMLGGPFGASPLMGPGCMMGPRSYQNARQQMIDDSYENRMRNSSQAMVPSGGGFFGSNFFGGGFFDPGFMMNGMFQQMEHFKARAANDPNSVMYSEQKVISVAPGPDGRPQRYESSDSLRKHGHVKETRRTLRDPSRGVEEMAIGHHIGERGHVIEKRRNKGGNIEENQKFVGIDKDEAKNFDDEWSHVTHDAVMNGWNRLHDERHQRHLPIEARRGDRERQSSPYTRSTNDRSRKPKGPIIEEAD